MATASEDLTASDEVQENEATLSDDLNCPLCMKIFWSPRRLPCLHSFCHDCLQSHIYSIASMQDFVKKLCCPLCGNVAFTGEVSADKLVRLFPLNTLMLSVLMGQQVKTDLVCNACQAQNILSPAENLCAVCEEALCVQCSKMHGISRLSTNHTILKIEDLPRKQQTVLQNNEMFRCTKHGSLPVEYYCKDHETPLCAKCFVDDHARCPEVIKLANKTPDLSEALNQMKAQMKILEDQLKQFAANNVLNLRKLESDVNNLTTEIRTLKKIINDALDDLETRVKEEGNKIFNDEKKRIEQTNQRCQSHVTAIRNSNVVLESASKYATQNQTFLLIKKITNQYFMSKRHNDDMFSKNDIVTLQLEVNKQLTSVINIPRGEIGMLRMKKNDEIPVVPDGFKPLKECIAECVDVKDIKGSKDKAPWYTKVIFTSNEHLLLVDYENKMLYLLDSLCNIVFSHTFLRKPFDVCIVSKHGEDIAAVSLPITKSVHLFSLKDNSITFVKQIQTKYMCYGIAAYNLEELIVSGPCGDDMRYYWSIITLDGKEKSYHEFAGAGTNQTYVALNAFKSRLYISVWKDDSLHCFGLNGTKHFTFTHIDLKGPQGVSIDRDDNVYVVGCRSQNIFQLSPGGLLIRIIVNEIEKYPRGICFDKNLDKFVISHGLRGPGFYRLVLKKG
ncbi:hypothetical protein ACJMK2_000997 [Sinanodonta woodiana]|uniref:Uncharacterized protein n=1 Tax=Sinanodonta woodiana TaxID=1069815 RepID=A0ABD3XQX6_SINWO